MKLRTINNTMNIRNAVEFLTNAILAGAEDEMILDTEMGNIAVEITEVKLHDSHDPNFGVRVYSLKDAPFSNFVKRLLHSTDQDDNIRWYVHIPYALGQGYKFTKELVIRAMLMVFMAEAVDDCPSTSYHSIGNDTIDAACAIYKMKLDGDDSYGYQDFNHDLCKLSVTPFQRAGGNYRSFCKSNKEVLRLRNRVAMDSVYSVLGDFRGHYDNGAEMNFGGNFYDTIFALIVEKLHIHFAHTKPLDLYMLATSKEYGRNKSMLPITLMKVCLIDRSLKDIKKED